MKAKSKSRKRQPQSLHDWFDLWWEGNGKSWSRRKGDKEYLCAIAFYYGVLASSIALEKLRSPGLTVNSKAVVATLRAMRDNHDAAIVFFRELKMLPPERPTKTKKAARPSRGRAAKKKEKGT